MSVETVLLLAMPLIGLLAVVVTVPLRRSSEAAPPPGRHAAHPGGSPGSASPATWLDRPWLLGSRFGAAAWLLLAFALMLVVNLILVFVEHDISDGWSMTAKMLDVGVIPLVLVYSRRLIKEWLTCFPNFVEKDVEQVQRWFDRRFEGLFKSRSNLLLGGIVGLLILAFEYQDGAFDQHALVARVVVVFASVVMTMLAGAALVVMVNGGFLVSRVGELSIHVSVSPYGVLSTGRMLVKAFTAATVGYLIAVSTMVLRTGFRPNWMILGWVVIVAILYVVVFVFPQWAIHGA